LGGYRIENDPYGQGFLERIAKIHEKYRKARLTKIEEVLKVCVPNMKNLKFERDKINGTPHLWAMYEHWRPDAGWQREDQFSDGTIRLLGIMWILLEGDSLLLLEEPELSLNEDIVRQIHKLIWNMQRQAKYRRQVFITTHSEALLQDKSIDAREVIRLEPTKDGTLAQQTSAEDLALVSAGYTVAEVLLPKTKPLQVDQLSLFKP
jgi:predicted ATPase